MATTKIVIFLIFLISNVTQSKPPNGAGASAKKRRKWDKTKAGGCYMGKPTLFFSHSSLDKELILAIKKKIDRATGGVLDIFMSSDGQSIPFGTNWVHRIEEGLQSAKIMFVFVTENSVRSGWIYFEAGYAYSKGIQVIPVGIGINIGELKAPLNLLQGFNVCSSDSLNNFISVINRAFDYRIDECFDESDYFEILSFSSTSNGLTTQFDELISHAEYELKSEYKKSDGSIEEHDVEGLFSKIISYLEESGVQHSIEQRYPGSRTTFIVANGVKILYKGKSPASITSHSKSDDFASLTFRLSSLNFETSFGQFLNFMTLADDRIPRYVKYYFRKGINCIVNEEDVSSVLSAFPEEYIADKSHVGGYSSPSYGVNFYLYEDYNASALRSAKDNPQYCISIISNFENVKSKSIVMLIQSLYDIGLIQRENNSAQ